MSYVMWPECFLTGIVPADVSDAVLCAHALTGWANCESGLGSTIPKHFGKVMQKIGERLKISPTPDNCSKWADDWLATTKD